MWNNFSGKPYIALARAILAYNWQAMKDLSLSLARWHTVRNLFAVLLLLALLSCRTATPEAQFQLSQSIMTLSDSGDSFEIINTGDSSFRWRLQLRNDSANPSAVEWLIAEPSQGELAAGARITVQLRFAPGLPAGSYGATLQVIAGRSQATVETTAQIGEGFLCIDASMRAQMWQQAVPEAWLQASSSHSFPSPYVPGQLLIHYAEPEMQPLQRDRQAQALARQHSMRRLRAAQGQEPELWLLEPNADLEATAAQLRLDPRIAYVEPNYYLYSQHLPSQYSLTQAANSRAASADTDNNVLAQQVLPNDPLLSEQWHMLGFGLPQAWLLETGQEHITVAVLDSGVDMQHEDLRARLLPGCDFFNASPNANPGSPSQAAGHGTHVAGIVAAVGNNGLGVAGIAHGGVRVLPVKVFDDDGRNASVEVVSQALRWAAGLPVAGYRRNPNPAQIINLSLGRSGTSFTLNEAVREAREAGSLVIVSAGNRNGGAGIFTPANAPGAVAVGSVGQDLRRSSFSNYDQRGVRSVDIMAPAGNGPREVCNGAGVRSTFPGNRYECNMGTSMASPFVAGVAALIWSQNPTWTAEEVKEQLWASAWLDEEHMNALEYGRGIVCADAALGASSRCGR